MNYLPKPGQKSEFVQKLFNNIANKYDLLFQTYSAGVEETELVIDKFDRLAGLIG